MSTWKPSNDNLKWYPHFDQPLPLEEILAIIEDPLRVASNAFFPFVSYEVRWQPFRKTGQVKTKKSRPIRYASRRDSYIFSAYRHVLSNEYERLLRERGLVNCVIAYRKIPAEGGRGKCNIHFARDAFDAVVRIGNCCAVALDISKFFESIDHKSLRERWCALIKQPHLPKDHYAVFKAITRYAVVDRTQVYRRLGYYGPKGKGVEGFLIPFKKMPKQLCSPNDFKTKIAGSTKYSRLIKKNPDPFGIPQGAPISDLLANLYLLDFDQVMLRYAASRGGVYYRYSDDILIILPGDGRAGQGARTFAERQIRKLGPRLKIKPQKTLTVKFFKDGGGTLNYRCLGDQRKNGLEYLGFRFDGKKVYLRDSTLGNFYRKIRAGTHAEARNLVARFQGKDKGAILDRYDTQGLIKRFGRVEEFDENSDYHEWTFWTYAVNASRIMGEGGRPILHQLRRHRELITRCFERELDEALLRRQVVEAPSRR